MTTTTPTLAERLATFLHRAESIDRALLGVVHGVEQSKTVQEIERLFPAAKALFAHFDGPEKLLEAVGTALPQAEMGLAAIEIITRFGKPMDANDMAALAEDKTKGG